MESYNIAVNTDGGKELLSCEERYLKNDLDKYYSIYNNNHIPMLIINYKTGEIVDANTAACNYYGYTKEHIIKLNISHINTLGMEEILSEMNTARSEARKIFRFKHRLSNGEIRDVEVYSGPIQLREESLLFSVIHDLKEKTEFEEELRKQKSFFEDLFENSPEAIAVLDNEFKIMNVNKSFEEMFLFKLEEIIDKDITKIMCNEKYYNESSYLQECIRKGEFIRVETLRKRKDKKLIDVSILGFPIISNGEKIGVYFIYSDLRRIKEEQKKFKIGIEKYLNLLNTTIDSIPDIISVINPDLTVELVNEAACRFFNRESNEFKNINWNKLVYTITGETDTCIAHTMETKKPSHMEKYIKSIDRYVDWYCRPVFDRNNEIMLIVERIKDITADKKHQEDLRHSKDKAEKASVLKTQFLANMSHEIRTPIGGIVGIIDMISDTKLTEEQKEYVDMLKYSAERLLSLVNDVLDISKIEAGKLELRKEQFSMHELLNKLINYFKVQSENKGLSFMASIDESVPDLLIGDADRLSQILFNLLGNAIKFTDTGHVGISVKLIRYVEDHAYINFSISDTGIGIPEDMLKELFVNFSQLNTEKNRRYGGTGLGLALSKKLVESMEGSISVESRYNEGSNFTFFVKISVVRFCNKMVDIIPADIENVKFQLPVRLNILVAEDESINQKIIKNILLKAGCNATIVSNGEQVLKLLDSDNFDILLLDMCMTGIDGYEVTKSIRDEEKKSGEHLPIIATSAIAIKEEVERCFALGVDEYIVKPINKVQLFQAILKLFERKNEDSIGFNMKELVDRLEGNCELLKEIIDEVISKKYETEFIGCMEKYIQKQDWERLLKHIHKYEGSLSHFNVKSMNESLKNVKNCIISKEFKDMDKSLDYLRDEYAKLKINLMAVKEKYS